MVSFKVATIATVVLAAMTATAAPPMIEQPTRLNTTDAVSQPFSLPVSRNKKTEPVPLESIENKCERDALLARAKWRVRCRWQMWFAVVWDVHCMNPAPDVDRCCDGTEKVDNTYTCAPFQPAKQELDYCTGSPGELDSQNEHDYPASWQICKCMWHDHCGNW